MNYTLVGPSFTRALSLTLFTIAVGLAAPVNASEFHVSTRGNDSNAGSRSAPLRSIQRAAELAQPGDVITVHAGIYRERINPPRGGTSDKKRIVYQAARGETVVIKGSEVITNWAKAQGKVWKAAIPNSFFGKLNPYADLIKGDWFTPKGREHHTGAVYVDGEWLVEATSLEDVMSETPPAWLTQGGEGYLLNVAWIQGAGAGAKRTPASAFSAEQGVQKAPCTEGGECIGFIEHGDWARYDNVELGEATQIDFRVASATKGGVIEVRLDKPDGALLGTCTVPHTGGWQSWSTCKARISGVSGMKNLCLVFRRKAESRNDGLANARLWFAKVDQETTTLWAQFDTANPNDGGVEINVRQAVFYPDKPGRDYITVRGFRMCNAATPWAPPTAEQIGLIGTHWSKGWIIENNVISHSVCSGIALGKHGDQWDNTSANTAEGYVKTIERGLANGWSREKIGHHIVRNNTISHCEQTAVVGSLGAAFCTVTGNLIQDIHVRRLFTGAEMAGIKFHGAIDTVISRNHIRRTCLGLWLDWMAQGTRVSGNLFQDNDRDLFVEVDHGPFVVDNNLFFSGGSLLDVSEGGAYAHNLFMGTIASAPEPNRETPFHPAHATTVAGLRTIKGGDSRFYNNIFVGAGAGAANAGAFGLAMYNPREYPLYTGGNVFYNGARPYGKETGQVVSAENPKATLAREERELKFRFNPGPGLGQSKTVLVTTDLLGKAVVPGLPYENADGSKLKIDQDFTGKKRSNTHPTPGPFEFRIKDGSLERTLSGLPF